MADTASLPALSLPVDAPTLAALHAEACIVCGLAEGQLIPVGHFYTPSAETGMRLHGWPAVACTDHKSAGVALCLASGGAPA